MEQQGRPKMHQSASPEPRPAAKPNAVEHFAEMLIFRSRWLLAPLYLGLCLALGLLMVKFVQELLHMLPDILVLTEDSVILGVLSLIDLTLTASLLLMVVFSGYENFVSKIDTGDHADRPEWMGKVDFSGLKMKLVASIVAISAIRLLKEFMNPHPFEGERLGWMLGIHMSFVISGVLLALMDRLAGEEH